MSLRTRLLPAATALIAIVAGSTVVRSDDLHPGLLEAVGFVMTGKDKLQRRGDALVSGTDIVVQSSEPCTFQLRGGVPPYNVVQIAFSKLGTRWRVDTPLWSHYRRLQVYGQRAVCHGEVPLKNIASRGLILDDPCTDEFEITSNRPDELTRYVDAIRYIHAEFCPPLPTKPY